MANRQHLFRYLLVVYVALAALVVGALAGEVLLRVERSNAYQLARPFREKNVFTSRKLRMGTPDSLWLKRWERYKPSSRVSTPTHGVRTNSFGYRTSEFTVEKLPGQIRVLCIGGSTTFQGSRNHLTYPALLEGLLAERYPGRDIEVLNLGISGTNSEYWLKDDEDSRLPGRLRIDRLLELDPDLVIQYNGANDIVGRYVGRYGDKPLRHGALMESSLLARRLVHIDRSAFEAAFTEALGHFSEIRRRFAERGVDYLVGTFARPDYDRAPADFQAYLDLTTEEWTRGGLRYFGEYAYLLDRFNQRLLSWAQSHGVEPVRIDKAVTEPELFIDICHLSDRGIEGMAEAFESPVTEVLESRANLLADSIGPAV